MYTILAKLPFKMVSFESNQIILGLLKVSGCFANKFTS